MGCGELEAHQSQGLAKIENSVVLRYHPQLRPTKAGRTIRIAAVITGYNEDGDELRRTLTGIAANLSTAQKMGLHWSEVCVFIIMDGREKISSSMVDYVANELQVGEQCTHV